ncbi:MAG: ABC transporter substrate-binding protein [Alphaproteobacteria bacterium]
MTRINIQFTRFSAFYSPLIATAAGGFLADEGLEPELSIAPPGVSAIAALLDGGAHVAQSAPSQGLSALEKGEDPPALHFAQVNEKDGFFLTARQPDADFSWSKLAGKRVLVDHGGQPLAMFKYACLKQGLDYDSIEAVDAGNVGEMDAAFRAGTGDYIHQQGPAPQQLEHDGAGAVVTGLGDAIGPCAFSSLAATREWLATDMARAFTRAYTKARKWINETPAAEIAAVERDHFPDIDQTVLASTIEAYQKLGNWSPHVEITREAFEVTLDVFRNVGRTVQGDAYARVVAPPPE